MVNNYRNNRYCVYPFRITALANLNKFSFLEIVMTTLSMDIDEVKSNLGLLNEIIGALEDSKK